MRALVLFIALCGPAAVHASPLCGVDGDDVVVAEDAAAPERVILPCALADNGSGPTAKCADAVIYINTTGGVLLCQIDIPALEAQTAAPIVEDKPAQPTPNAGATSPALAAATPVLPIALVRDVVITLPDARGAPRDGHGSLTTPPS